MTQLGARPAAGLGRGRSTLTRAGGDELAWLAGDGERETRPAADVEADLQRVAARRARTGNGRKPADEVTATLDRMAAAAYRDADTLDTTEADYLAAVVQDAEARHRDPGPAPSATSWQPVDLAPYLAGTVERAAPSVGIARSDGLRLLYPGKEHTVIGEMESGKSWLAYACAAAELAAGRPVLYLHFEESDPSDTVERLQALQVPDHLIRELFTFIGPTEPLPAGVLAQLLSDIRPSLVVLDGVNEAMSLHSQAIREEDGAAAFRRLLVKPCTAVGAATLACDHVVKDKERRGRDALGSIHKGNGLTGAQILLENVDPFGRDLRGCSRVFIGKDRPGHHRRHGRPGDIPGKTFMGMLVVDDTRRWQPFLELAFHAPGDRSHDDDQDQDKAPPNPRDDDDRTVMAAIRALITAGQPANVRHIRATTGISKARTDAGLTRLHLAGRLDEHEGSRGARLFAVTVPQDQPPS